MRILYSGNIPASSWQSRGARLRCARPIYGEATHTFLDHTQLRPHQAGSLNADLYVISLLDRTLPAQAGLRTVNRRLWRGALRVQGNWAVVTIQESDEMGQNITGLA